VGTVLDDPPPFDRDDARGVPQCRQPMAIKMTVRFSQMRRISDYRSAEAVWGKFAADSPVEGDSAIQQKISLLYKQVAKDA
jgi:hypothetical protein